MQILSDIESLEFEDICEFYDTDDEFVIIPDEKLGLYQEEEDDRAG